MTFTVFIFAISFIDFMQLTSNSSVLYKIYCGSLCHLTWLENTDNFKTLTLSAAKCFMIDKNISTYSK